MPSMYLAQSELAMYGAEGATQPQILAASMLVDAYLKRPEGLQWMPDFAGLPCYMASLTPTFSFPLPADISPGTGVVIPLNAVGLVGTSFGSVGDVVVLDRASIAKGGTNNAEACVINTNLFDPLIPTNSTNLVLSNVQRPHASGTLVEFGLTIREQKTLPSQRSIARLGSWPVTRLLSGLGSYRYGRRSDQNAGLFQDYNIMAVMETFGGPPEWIPWDVSAADFSEITNEVWIPSGLFLAYYSDVRIFYIAGFSQANIPPIIKQVTANAIAANVATADLIGGVKMARAGDTALTRFAATVLDNDTRQQLLAYQARAFV